MDDLDLIKAFAELEGVTLTYSNNIGEWSSGTPYGSDDYEYNPIACGREIIEAMLKYNVGVNTYGSFVYIDSDYTDKPPIATVTYDDFDDYIAFGRAVIECILESEGKT